MGSTKYVAAVFSMRPRWLKQNPDAARLRIRVLAGKTFNRIEDGERADDVLRKRYRRWVHEDPVAECETELDAWEAAIDIQKSILAQKRKVDLHFGENRYRIYGFEMNPSVIHNSKFAKLNPSDNRDGKSVCVYVGITSIPIKERYLRHCSDDHRTKTRWGQRYFLRPFETAFRQDYLDRFEDEGNQVDGLNKYEALTGELAFFHWLQKHGVAAYSK